MKSDKEILEVYRYIKNKVLPELNVTYELEKKILEKKNILNKNKCNSQIAGLYNGYHEYVSSMWESIYSSPEEYDNTIKNIKIIQSGKTVTPNATEIGQIVEQFCMALDTAVVSILWYYSGNGTKESADKIHDASIGFMLKIMDIIDTKYIK